MIVNERYKLLGLHKCQYICKVKAKTTKILKWIKTLFTVKTEKYIYTTFRWQRQLDHVYSNIVKILVKV